MTTDNTISIQNKQNEKLVGILEEGSDKELKQKLVILCHGFLSGNKNNIFFPDVSKKITDYGFSCFRFDFSGYGESEGKFEENTITKNIEDIKIVSEYFKNKGYEIFSIIGHSMGGSEVIVNQSKYNLAKCVIAISPRVYNGKAILKRYTKEQLDLLESQGFFMYEVGGKSYKISKSFIDDRLKNYEDIRINVKNLMTPVLLIHGTVDTTTDISESRDLSKSITHSSMLMLKEVEGANHNYTEKEHADIAMHTIITFLGWVNHENI